MGRDGGNQRTMYKVKNNIFQKRFLGLIYVIICFVALLLPSILAGIRDYTIGTDVLVYGNYWFNFSAVSTDFVHYEKYATSSSIGYLYAAFNFFVSRFSDNPHVFYFLYSLIENVIVYIALKKNDDMLDVPLGMACYYFLFFNTMLNVLRQGMALCLVLFSFYYLRKSKFIKYVLINILAILFHSTAIIGFSIGIIYLLFKIKQRKFVYGLIIGGFILITLFFRNIVILLGNLNQLSSRYVSFVTSDSSGGGFYVHLLLFCLPVLLVYLFLKISDEFSQEFIVFKTIIFLSMIFSFLSLRFDNISRVSLYFDFMFIFAIPTIEKISFSQFRIGRVKNSFSFIVYSYLIVYWIIVYGLMDSGQTVPFLFMKS
jgi:hypothetical protein